MNIQNQVFFITGGGSGLGEATARLLTENGGKVIIVDLNEERGKKIANELDGLFVKTDVSSEQEVQDAVTAAVQTFGEINGVVNCAGIGNSHRIVGRHGVFPLDAFKKVVEVNLIGTFNVIRLTTAAMVNNEPNAEGERGVIINTASVAAFDGQIGQAAYSASKAGIVGMTLPIARDLASKGIRVMTIAPGIFNTPLMAQATNEIKAALGKQVPFPPRLGESPEYAMLVKSIIENPMLNGETIRLDGAIRMAPR